MNFQLIDDHSAYAVTSHAATGRTSRDEIRAVCKEIRSHGVPLLLLSDNGLALNPSRRGIAGQLVQYVSRLGVDPATGSPKADHPRQEREVTPNLSRYLDKRFIAANLRELQAPID
ncbi:MULTISPECIES: hypothetical protein [unclassified Microbacterium]|uniref:hypothetical protein n=1 Tax=unclassified Microbacterium TaxID=2609290 RepID=UPI00214C5390|nr:MULTISPECIES: hypothetical protein [unclassified Microbacterium]MCR2811374.1 hypothetical protein [Microbacterium sp. zg.B185]WIM19580.1 hypothetical protein QNO12_01865 [Microbacterium sp. zg-B185]